VTWPLFSIHLIKVYFRDEISLNAKAWNGRIICAWLAETLPIAARGFPSRHDEGRVSLACYALKLGYWVRSVTL
jgi:hypothetical protein